MSIKAKHLIHLPTDRCNRYNRSKSRNKNTILDGLGSQNHNTIFRFMLPEVSEHREIIFLYCYFSCLFTADKFDMRQQSPPPIKDSRCWSSWSIILGWGPAASKMDTSSAVRTFRSQKTVHKRFRPSPWTGGVGQHQSKQKQIFLIQFGERRILLC